MIKSIVEDIRKQFDYGNRLTRLIIINCAVFVAMLLVKLGFVLTAGFTYDARFIDVVRFFALSSDLLYNVTHPWVVITHMFLHTGLWHFAFNMLFLFWFGRIVGDLIGDHRIVPLYLLSGLFGALVYLMVAPFLHPGGSYAYGASAAVMGIVLTSGLIAPNYLLRLLLIGDVRLKYVVLALILLDLLSIANLSNTGGHFAHLGGAAFGWIFVSSLRQGSDLSVPVNRLLSWFERLFRGRPSGDRRRSTSRVYVSHKTRPSQRAASTSSRPKDEQEKIDAILDKIKEKGYDSLTAEEKEFLFQASKK